MPVPKSAILKLLVTAATLHNPGTNKKPYVRNAVNSKNNDPLTESASASNDLPDNSLVCQSRVDLCRAI